MAGEPYDIDFDLSTLNLSAGVHTITVKARASGYADSKPSDAVSYVTTGEGTAVGTYRLDGRIEDARLYSVNKEDLYNLKVTTKYLGYEVTNEGYFLHGFLGPLKNNTSKPSVENLAGYPAIYGKNNLYSTGKPFYGIAYYTGEDVTEGYTLNGPIYFTIHGGEDATNEVLIDFLKRKMAFGFTIDGTTYYAKDGMTWAEWVNSEYNTDGFTVDNTNSILLPNSKTEFVQYWKGGLEPKSYEVIKVWTYVRGK